MKRYKAVFARYRILPLMLVGLITMAVFVALTLCIWAFIVYNLRADISRAVVVPALIYSDGIFISCCLMTFLIKGGTVFPSAVLSLALAVVSLLLADVATLSFVGVLLRIFFSLLCGVVAFTLTKLYCILRARSAARKAELGEQKAV